VKRIGTEFSGFCFDTVGAAFVHIALDLKLPYKREIQLAGQELVTAGGRRCCWLKGG